MLVISLLFFSILPVSAYAQMDDGNQVIDTGLVFQSEKDQIEFLAAVDEYNKESQARWENALKSSDGNVTTLSGNATNLVVPLGIYSTSSASVSKSWGSYSLHLGSYVTYDKIGTGSPVWLHDLSIHRIASWK